MYFTIEWFSEMNARTQLQKNFPRITARKALKIYLFPSSITLKILPKKKKDLINSSLSALIDKKFFCCFSSFAENFFPIFPI